MCAALPIPLVAVRRRYFVLCYLGSIRNIRVSLYRTTCEGKRCLNAMTNLPSKTTETTHLASYLYRSMSDPFL